MKALSTLVIVIAPLKAVLPLKTHTTLIVSSSRTVVRVILKSLVIVVTRKASVKIAVMRVAAPIVVILIERLMFELDILFVRLFVWKEFDCTVVFLILAEEV